MIKRAHDEGHQIGNHTYSHEYLTLLTKEQAIWDIETVNDYVESVIGIRPHVYRPPYLTYNSTVLSYFPNMTSITCSVDSRDWAGTPVETIITRVMQTVSGDIILLHANQANTRAALGEIIDRFNEKGFDCVTIDELFARMGKVMETGKNYKYAL